MQHRAVLMGSPSQGISRLSTALEIINAQTCQIPAAMRFLRKFLFGSRSCCVRSVAVQHKGKELPFMTYKWPPKGSRGSRLALPDPLFRTVRA